MGLGDGIWDNRSTWGRGARLLWLLPFPFFELPRGRLMVEAFTQTLRYQDTSLQFFRSPPPCLRVITSYGFNYLVPDSHGYGNEGSVVINGQGGLPMS
jgi:hypothetical protein